MICKSCLTVWTGFFWLRITQDLYQCLGLVKIVINLMVAQTARNFLHSHVTTASLARINTSLMREDCAMWTHYMYYECGLPTAHSSHSPLYGKAKMLPSQQHNVISPVPFCQTARSDRFSTILTCHQSQN